MSKFVVVPQSAVEEMRKVMDNSPSAWESVDLVIVRDEDYETAIAEARKILPPSISMRECELKNGN